MNVTWPKLTSMKTINSYSCYEEKILSIFFSKSVSVICIDMMRFSWTNCLVELLLAFVSRFKKVDSI